MQKLIINGPMFTIEVSAEDEKDVFRKAALWLSLPIICGFKGCGASLILDYRTPKTFKYYTLKCTNATTPHCVNLGQKMDTQELYYDSSKPWELFRAGQVHGGGGEDRATPGTASAAAQHTGAAAAPSSSGSVAPPQSNGNGSATAPANIGQLKNQLLKLITECKNAGIRCGLTPGDVGPMDERMIQTETGRVAALLGPQGVA